MVHFTRCVAKYSRCSLWSDEGVTIQLIPTAKRSIFSESVTNLRCEKYCLSCVMLVSCSYLGSYQYFLWFLACIPFVGFGELERRTQADHFHTLNRYFHFFLKNAFYVTNEDKSACSLWDPQLFVLYRSVLPFHFSELVWQSWQKTILLNSWVAYRLL